MVFPLTYPSNWNVQKLNEQNVVVNPPQDWGNVDNITIAYLDFKKGCNFVHYMMSNGLLPMIYTNSNDPRVLNEFDSILSTVKVSDDTGSVHLVYTPYVNLGRGFDLEHFSLFSLLFYEPFQTATSWSGNDVQLMVNADPENARNKVIALKTQTAASFFEDIDWPNGVTEVTFDYLFPQPNTDGDLTVYVYDPKTGQPEGEKRIVYYDSSAISLAKGRWENAAFGIGVGIAGLDFRGKNARLNFVLRSEKGEEVQVLLDNVTAWGL